MEKKIFKHILVLSLLAGLLLTAMVNGQSAFDIRWGQQQTYSDTPANTLRQWAEGIDGRIGGVSLGTGTTFYLDSNVSSEGDGTSWTSAKDTMTEAMALCTANNGDQIRVAQGHVQSGDAANFWGTVVAGVTIIHEGSGSDQGTWTFADTDTAINVAVANVHIIGGRYLAGISEVVAGFILTGDADYCTMSGLEFPEPTTSSFEFNIAVQITTGTDNLTIAGCTQLTADATGADHFLNGGAGAVSGLTVVGNTLHGEYAIAAIFSDQADLETYIRYNQITQMTASEFGIEYTGAATGICADNRVNATVLFEVDPGSMAYWKNMEGDTLPEGVSLNGQLGAFTGPAAGAAQDDNAKASLDLAHTDLDAILAQAASFSSPNYLAVSTGVFDTTGTWSTVASHEIATVTGLVRMIIIPECTVSVTSVSNTGTIELGDEVGSTSIIAASTLGAGVMVAGELWTDATLTRTILTQTQINATTIVVGQGQDIGYEVKTNALDAGTMVFHIFWTPLDATGAVAAGAGGTL